MNRLYKIFLMLLLVMATGGAAYGYKKSHSFVHAEVSTHNLLALSWQNAFCETHRRYRECRDVKPEEYSASHFTLHGLWPQPRNRVNCPGPRTFRISHALYRRLLHVMPAARSGLHRHEWIKHGRCYGKDPEGDFRDAIALTEQINASAVRDLFARHIGKRLTIEQVRLAFNRAFGPGAGRKVKMKCSRGMITELWINLKGRITPRTSLKELMKGAPAFTGSCRQGIVDAAGFSSYGRSRSR